jgi:hypothetical protein
MGLLLLLNAAQRGFYRLRGQGLREEPWQGLPEGHLTISKPLHPRVPLSTPNLAI